MTAKLDQLAKQAEAARDALNREFEREFPVGSRVRWLYQGKYEQIGVVEYNSLFGDMQPEMRVQNERTGRLVWVKLWMRPRRVEE